MVFLRARFETQLGDSLDRNLPHTQTFFPRPISKPSVGSSTIDPYHSDFDSIRQQSKSELSSKRSNYTTDFDSIPESLRSLSNLSSRSGRKFSQEEDSLATINISETSSMIQESDDHKFSEIKTHSLTGLSAGSLLSKTQTLSSHFGPKKTFGQKISPPRENRKTMAPEVKTTQAQTTQNMSDFALLAQKDQIFSMLGNLLDTRYGTVSGGSSTGAALNNFTQLGQNSQKPSILTDNIYQKISSTNQNLENEILTVKLLKEQVNLTCQFLDSAKSLRDQTIQRIDQDFETKKARSKTQKSRRKIKRSEIKGLA